MCLYEWPRTKMAIIHHLRSLLLFIVYLLDLVDAGSSCGDKNKDGYTAGITTTTTTHPSNYVPYGGQSDIKPPPPSKTTSTTTTTTTITPSIIPEGGCRVYTREEKYKMLADLGSYNQIFMADTAEEAALNFAPVFKKLLYGEKPYPDYDDVRIINGTVERACRSKERPRSPAPPSSSTTSPRKLQNGFFFVLAWEACMPAGSAVQPRGLRLCTHCQRAFKTNCFPGYINAAQCQTEANCIFSNGTPYGFSRKEVLPMYLLRNKGTSGCEDLVEEQMDLPVSCQCYLSESAPLQATP
ncbi:unnamed protein product [Cylicocyclus nassatus]|uniref:Spaetzle domain-containing protein n=1 Tax=Cylicocyclus nassatus TaxID=53992 RepID=A0AA36DRS4_CYLNA|nr:unnamed protein product [Cylicocyclus nassatus]